MAEPRFMVEFYPNNQTALNQVKTFIENRLTSDNITVRVRDSDWSGNVADGVCLSLRVPSRTDCERLVDWGRDNISQLASRGRGRITFHMCSHESDNANCGNSAFREYKF